MPELDPQPRDEQGHGYVDFLASEKLSVGLSVWPAGSVDRQQPHGEDEAGSLVFVAAHVEHRFHDIEEDLRVLVFWAPPHRPVHHS